MLTIWIALFVILIVIEMVTVNLVTIWFAAGALASAVSSLFISNVIIQILIFIVVSVVTLFVTRPLIKKFKINEITPTNLDMVIGKTAIVTEDIDPLSPGEVKVNGKRWTAISTNQINVGKRVKVLSIEGVKLKVKEIEEEK